MGTDTLRDRMLQHADKVKKLEEMEAVLAGVFDQETEAARERFADLVTRTIKPAFDEFKTTLREMGRDAVIIVNLSHTPVQSIGLTLLDRYLKFGAGKTLKLVNPRKTWPRAPIPSFTRFTGRKTRSTSASAPTRRSSRSSRKSRTRTSAQSSSRTSSPRSSSAPIRPRTDRRARRLARCAPPGTLGE